MIATVLYSYTATTSATKSKGYPICKVENNGHPPAKRTTAQVPVIWTPTKSIKLLIVVLSSKCLIHKPFGSACSWRHSYCQCFVSTESICLSKTNFVLGLSFDSGGMQNIWTVQHRLMWQFVRHSINKHSHTNFGWFWPSHPVFIQQRIPKNTMKCYCVTDFATFQLIVYLKHLLTELNFSSLQTMSSKSKFEHVPWTNKSRICSTNDVCTQELGMLCQNNDARSWPLRLRAAHPLFWKSLAPATTLSQLIVSQMSNILQHPFAHMSTAISTAILLPQKQPSFEGTILL